MSAALLRALDAGDRLAEALDAGDLLGAASHLHERQAALDALLADPPEAPPALADRVRQQDARLREAFRSARRAVAERAAGTRRAASAAASYRGAPAAPLLDTVPRGR